jgi:hypothetical protein
MELLKQIVLWILSYFFITKFIDIDWYSEILLTFILGSSLRIWFEKGRKVR